MGRPLTDFRREQFGGVVGGAEFARTKLFFLTSFEGIRENLTRANLSQQVGAFPVSDRRPNHYGEMKH